jgi:ankyrin repeat protein
MRQDAMSSLMFEEAVQLAKQGNLPEWSNRWELADGNGWTVAHVAASFTTLPNGFDKWSLADGNGCTVAHAAVQYGHLPKEFRLWELSDIDGQTVAHIAASHGHLPEDVPDYVLGLVNAKNKKTVAETVMGCIWTPASLLARALAFMQRWEETKEWAWTTKDKVVNQSDADSLGLPKFLQRVQKENVGDAKSDLRTFDEAVRLARQKTLPERFDHWDWADENGRTVAHVSAEFGRLPEDFTHWDLADMDGFTVAHAAARYGHLSKDFAHWNLADKDGWTVAHVAARYGHLPKDFAHWNLADKDGWTVAHVAAQFGHLPKSFDRWGTVGPNGCTVAHIAAVYRLLPKGFDMWDLATESGLTVAQIAAQYGHLPEEFDQWDLTNKNGWTVAHVAAQFGHLPKRFDQWDLANKDSWTVAHVAAQFDRLPQGFDQWGLVGPNGWTVAHLSVKNRHLPQGFDSWDLRNVSGWTVAHMAAHFGHLPETVPDHVLGLVDAKGRIVAHEIVDCGIPRTSRDLLSRAAAFLAEKKAAKTDLTPDEAARLAEKGKLPERFHHWKLSWGKTIAYEAMHGRLPAGVDRWNLCNRRWTAAHSWTVAHEAAWNGNLPEDVPDDVLSLTDTFGRTVAEIIAQRPHHGDTSSELLMRAVCVLREKRDVANADHSPPPETHRPADPPPSRSSSPPPSPHPHRLRLVLFGVLLGLALALSTYAANILMDGRLAAMIPLWAPFSQAAPPSNQGQQSAPDLQLRLERHKSNLENLRE